ncbi:MAG: zinc-dependent metalloprotease [Spirosomataceae bacterium]
MKKTILLLLLSGAVLLVKAQTIIRFKPKTSVKSGSIEQIGYDFTKPLRIELPQKTLRLTLRPSRLKQYTTLLTSEGQQPSLVELFEATDNRQKYYVTIINHQFHGLLLAEDGQLFTLEKEKDSLYTYQKAISDGADGIVCGHAFSPTQARSPARRQASLLSGCYEFPIAFVCDYAHYRYFAQNAAEVEADNLLKLAAAQETWSPYAFNAEVVFKAVGQLIYTNNDTPPWPLDGSQALNTIWGELNHNWEKPKGWKKYKSLIVTGLTGTNYGSIASELLTWGFGGGGQNEFAMGTIVMKGFLDKPQSKWLFAHELGHVFGAGHDDVPGYVMQPTYSSNAWSPKSKASINGTLSNLESQKLLRECSRLIFSYELSKDSLIFAWQTNYEDQEDSFLIEYSRDEQKTWVSVNRIAAAGTFSYQYRAVNNLSLGQIMYFRVRQQGINLITSNVLTVVLTGLSQTSDGVLVYPQPFSRQLTIETDTPVTGVIYDLTGKPIHRLSVPQPLHLINTAAWKAGVYFLQLDKEPSKTYKILKQDF